MNAYLDWSTRHAPTWLPANIEALLADCGPWGQNPYTGAPASIRMVPGIDKRLLAPMTPKLKAAMLAWVNEEVQRHLPDGPPDPVFYSYAGLTPTAWPLNQQGKAVPITTWDALHLTVDQLLTVAARHPSASVKIKAAKQASKLREAVYKVVLDPVKVGKQGQALSGNARAAGWTLSFAVRMQRALPDPRDFLVMKTLVDGLHLMAQDGDVMVPVNPADQAQDATTDDHGGCGWTLWMILGPYLRGLCEVREFGDESGEVDDLINGALDLASMAFAAGEKHYGVAGKMVDAMDPSGAVYFQKGSAMTPWALMGLRAADALGMLTPELKAQAVALRDTVGWLDDRKATAATTDHAMSLMLLCGGWDGVGWKT